MNSVVIGSGFGGLAASLRLRAKGYKVTLIEKHPDLGGRARVFRKDNFIYDGVKYNIVGYRFTCVGRRTNGPKVANVTGASLEPIKGYLSRLGSGDVVQFDQIRAVGPDKQVKYLPSTGGTLQ